MDITFLSEHNILYRINRSAEGERQANLISQISPTNTPRRCKRVTVELVTKYLVPSACLIQG